LIEFDSTLVCIYQVRNKGISKVIMNLIKKKKKKKKKKRGI